MMEERLKRIAKWFNRERIAIITGIYFIIMLIVMEILGIVLAVGEHNYLLLSFFTYIILMVITECFVKKNLFKKVVKALLKKTYTSNLLFFIVGCITIALSWKYFIAFLICIPQAILYGEYCRLKEGF